jgi:hypothetical protein
MTVFFQRLGFINTLMSSSGHLKQGASLLKWKQDQWAGCCISVEPNLALTLFEL